jgi:hypothetical protein
MRFLMSVGAMVLVVIASAGAAEAAKRQMGRLQTNSATVNGNTPATFRQTLPYNPDPSRSTGNYPDWARRAFIGRGSGGR